MQDRLEAGGKWSKVFGALGRYEKAIGPGGWGVRVRCGSYGLAVTESGQTSLFSGSEKWTMIATHPGRSPRCSYERFLTTSRWVPTPPCFSHPCSLGKSSAGRLFPGLGL